MGRLYKRKVFFSFAYILYVAVFVFAAGEIFLRVRGARPFSLSRYDVIVEPGGRFNQTHPTLGFTHIPGRFTVSIPGPDRRFVFHVTNRENSLRITHPLETYREGSSKPEIWIFGCSMTYGWTLNDEETYPWVLQTKFPEYEVVNFGGSGYCTEHCLIQLREALQKQTPPKLAIIGSYSDHHDRNVFSRSWQKRLSPDSLTLGPVLQPYARLGPDGKIHHFMAHILYPEFPLQRYSALVNTLEEQYNNYQDKWLQGHEVSKGIYKEFHDLCRKHNIKMLVAFLTLSDEEQKEEWPFCQKEGIPTVDVSVDLLLPENTNLPYDAHASAVADKRYADALEAFIKANNLLQ